MHGRLHLDGQRGLEVSDRVAGCDVRGSHVKVAPPGAGLLGKPDERLGCTSSALAVAVEVAIADGALRLRLLLRHLPALLGDEGGADVATPPHLWLDGSADSADVGFSGAKV